MNSIAFFSPHVLRIVLRLARVDQFMAAWRHAEFKPVGHIVGTTLFVALRILIARCKFANRGLNSVLIDHQAVLVLQLTRVVDFIGNPLSRGAQHAKPEPRDVASIDALDRMTDQEIEDGWINAELGA